jgi:hypothetical protein
MKTDCWFAAPASCDWYPDRFTIFGSSERADPIDQRIRSAPKSGIVPFVLSPFFVQFICLARSG